MTERSLAEPWTEAQARAWHRAWAAFSVCYVLVAAMLPTVDRELTQQGWILELMPPWGEVGQRGMLSLLGLVAALVVSMTLGPRVRGGLLVTAALLPYLLYATSRVSTPGSIYVFLLAGAHILGVVLTIFLCGGAVAAHAAARGTLLLRLRVPLIISSLTLGALCSWMQKPPFGDILLPPCLAMGGLAVLQMLAAMRGGQRTLRVIRWSHRVALLAAPLYFAYVTVEVNGLPTLAGIEGLKAGMAASSFLLVFALGLANLEDHKMRELRLKRSADLPEVFD